MERATRRSARTQHAETSENTNPGEAAARDWRCRYTFLRIRPASSAGDRANKATVPGRAHFQTNVDHVKAHGTHDVCRNCNQISRCVAVTAFTRSCSPPFRCSPRSFACRSAVAVFPADSRRSARHTREQSVRALTHSAP